MTRPLPEAVEAQIRPIPASFVPVYTAPDSRYLCWAATLDVDGYGPVDVELGYHIRKGHEDEGTAHLRASAWQATELARLGCMNLLSHCLVDRHKARKQG